MICLLIAAMMVGLGLMRNRLVSKKGAPWRFFWRVIDLVESSRVNFRLTAALDKGQSLFSHHIIIGGLSSERSCIEPKRWFSESKRCGGTPTHVL